MVCIEKAQKADITSWTTAVHKRLHSLFTCSSQAVSKFGKRSVQAEGIATPKKAYEISKSYDFKLDFGISSKISRFQMRYQDFSEISMRFQDFKWDFRISIVISGFQMVL